MKKFISRFLLLSVFSIMTVGLLNCDGKDDDPDPEPVDPHAVLFDKWWATDDGLGDYIFHSDGTYDYQYPIATGTYTFYLNADSVLMQQDGGGSWSIWFHTFTDSVFTMSQGNEQHLGIYTYRPKP